MSFSPADAFAQMVNLLTQVRDEVRKLQDVKPPTQAESRPQRYYLTSAGRSGQQIPTELHITGLLISGDSAGRGVLTIGTEQIPFWILGQVTTYYDLGMDNRIVVRGERPSWTPPSGTTVWDVILIGHPR
jgi:hypothetical protein